MNCSRRIIATWLLCGCSLPGPTASRWGPSDLDGDGHAGLGQGGSDCDDDDPGVHPLAAEVCNGRDDNCNGWVDDQDPLRQGGDAVWYDQDQDRDGAGGGSPLRGCRAPAGAPTVADCNDQQALIFPGAVERCNGWDDDCDGQVDEADADLAEGELLFTDQDLDGFGDEPQVRRCTPTPGWVADGGDCDDNDAFAFPGGWDLCQDGIDQDCSGSEPNPWVYPLPMSAQTQLPSEAGQLDAWLSLPQHHQPAVHLILKDDQSLVYLHTTGAGLTIEVNSVGGACEATLPDVSLPSRLHAVRVTWSGDRIDVWFDHQQVLQGCQAFFHPGRLEFGLKVFEPRGPLPGLAQVGWRRTLDPAAPLPVVLTPELGYDRLWRFEGPASDRLPDQVAGDELTLDPALWTPAPCN